MVVYTIYIGSIKLRILVLHIDVFDTLLCTLSCVKEGKYEYIPIQHMYVHPRGIPCIIVEMKPFMNIKVLILSKQCARRVS